MSGTGSATVAGGAAVLRAGYEAFAAGDIPAVLAALDPGIEWVIAPGAPAEYAGTHRGHDGVVNGVFRRLGEVWASFEVRPERFIESGDDVIVLGRYAMVAPSGGRGEVAFVHAWRMRDGRGARFQDYSDTAAMRDLREGR